MTTKTEPKPTARRGPLACLPRGPFGRAEASLADWLWGLAHEAIKAKAGPAVASMVDYDLLAAALRKAGVIEWNETEDGFEVWPGPAWAQAEAHCPGLGALTSNQTTSPAKGDHNKSGPDVR